MFPPFREYRGNACIDERKQERGNTMEIYMRKPGIDLYPGIKVSKDTKFEYKNENVHQVLENLIFHSTTRVVGEGYESVYNTTIHLNEGDVLVFEEAGRGYIKPVEEMVTVAGAITELSYIQDVR